MSINWYKPWNDEKRIQNAKHIHTPQSRNNFFWPNSECVISMHVIFALGTMKEHA